MESKDKDTGWNLGWVFLVIVIVAALVVCFLFFLFFWTEWSPARTTTSELGQMGDFFGGMLNPLVSALTLFVAIRVWRLQEKELNDTKKALGEQAKTAEQQRQEQRFFDLLNVYQRTVDSISYNRSERHSSASTTTIHSTGKPALDDYLNTSSANGGGKKWLDFAEAGHASWQITQRNNTTATVNMDDISKCARFWQIDSQQFDHYFRVIFRILTEAGALLGDQHFRYIKLFRAQLGRSELIILGFHLWLDDEGKKMHPLAEKYGLLKHLPKGHLRTELEKLHPRVFGRNRAQLLQALPPTQPEANL